MKLFEITSGLLAIVVVALGANYHINSAKVEKELLVVGGHTQTDVSATSKLVVKQSETWNFNGGSSASPTNAEEYSQDANEPCGGEPTTVCKIVAPEDGDTGRPDMGALVELPGGGFATVASRINEALTPPLSTNETVQSLRSH